MVAQAFVTNRAAFADELITATVGLAGLVIYIDAGAGNPFSAIGLGFSGAHFYDPAGVFDSSLMPTETYGIGNSRQTHGAKG